MLLLENDLFKNIVLCFVLFNLLMLQKNKQQPPKINKMPACFPKYFLSLVMPPYTASVSFPFCMFWLDWWFSDFEAERSLPYFESA